LHIKSRSAGIRPEAVVIVATIRALEMHGGVAKTELEKENIPALTSGFANLQKHIETIRSFGLPVVVAINKFITDTDVEVETLLQWCQQENVAAALTEVWEKGGEGGIELAEKLLSIIDKEENNFTPLYDLADSLETKV
ncbi:formate--tetrahydrofolate ligase, partial [Alkalihalophilus pseudofirmus]